MGWDPWVRPISGSMPNCMTLLRIAIAPTARSPPYRCSWVLKQMDSRLSVDCMINGDTPSASTGPMMRGFRCSRDRRIRRVVFLPVKKRSTQTAETACERMVAKAAPWTPIPNAKIKIGSKTMLQTAPITVVFMPVFANPWEVMNMFSPMTICTKMVPAA